MMMTTRRQCLATAALFATLACGGAESHPGPFVPLPPKLVCQVSIAATVLTITTTQGTSFDVASTNCDRIAVSGPSLPTAVVLAGSGTVVVPPGGASGLVEAKGTAANGTSGADTVQVVFLRPVNAHVVGQLPASGPANSTYNLRIVKSDGTRCSAMWMVPSAVPMLTIGSILPSARLDSVDVDQVNVRLGSYISAQDRFAIICTGEDGSLMQDVRSMQTTYPQLTSIDSIIPRTAPPDIVTTFRVYAHGCPFVSALGQKGLPGAVDGTLAFPWGISLTNASAIAERDYMSTTFVSCNVATFIGGWSGSAPGEVRAIYIKNPGQPAVIGSITLR
jgi:hypothetical protein